MWCAALTQSEPHALSVDSDMHSIIAIVRAGHLVMSMRQPMLIHPAEARCDSANNIQAAVRLDNRLGSQGTIDQIARPLKTDPVHSHEIKIDKSYRLLNSDEGHSGLIVTALVASTIFALFAISALPWPFASTSGKRSASSLNLDSSPALVSKKEDRLALHDLIIQTDGPSSAQLPQNSNISPSANNRAKSSVSAASTTSSIAKDLQARVKLTATPETKPTTIDGWTLREVANGTAVLEGPDGIRTVARGDMIPGVGRVESIFRWGSRPIVATSRGLISTP
jgi:hypothetical protein